MIKQKRSNGLMFHFQPHVGMVGITLDVGMGMLCCCLGGALLGVWGVLLGHGFHTLTAIGKAGECGIACDNKHYHKQFWVGLGACGGDVVAVCAGETGHVRG